MKQHWDFMRGHAPTRMLDPAIRRDAQGSANRVCLQIERWASYQPRRRNTGICRLTNLVVEH